MTNIGYATLSIIPSLDGVSKSVQKQLGALDGKKFGKAFGKDIADGVKASESDVKLAFEGHAKLADRAADATGKLKVAQAGYQDLIEKGVRSGQRYERAKAQLEKATRDEVRATRAATEALKDYEAAQKRAASGLDGIGSGFGAKLKSLAGEAASGGSNAASGFVEGFGGPIAALGTKAGPVGLALAAAAGVALGAGALIAKNVMAGMERELAADRIQAQLGLSDAEAARFGESAGRVYGGAFGESMADVQQAMSDVASTLDMSSGAVLEDMTAKALTFRDVFGTDVAESIALAQNMIVNGFAPDASTAFDLMTTGFQRFPAAMRDELPEVLNEYSTYFQSLGFSGEEAIGMLVKIAPQGKIALDKLGDSLKELTIRATDLEDKGAQDVLAAMGLNGQDVSNNLLAGGDQSNEQFDQIIDKLLGIQDPANQAAAAIALFGTPLEDLDKAKIPAFLASMDNAASSMQGFAGSSQEMVDTVGSNAATTVESAKRAIESGMASMQSSLAQAFGPSIEQIANFLIEHQDQITGFFMTAANAGAEFASAMLGIAGMVTRGLGLIVQGVGDAAGWINDGFAKIVGAAATAADAVGLDGLAGDLRGAQDQLQTMADDLHSAGNGIVDFSDSMLGASMNLHDFDANLAGTQTSAQNAAAQIESVGNQIANLPSGAQINIDAIVVFKDQAGRAIDPAQLLGYNPNEFATAGDAQRARRGLPPSTVGPVTPGVVSTTPRPSTPFTLPSSATPGSSPSSSTSSSVPSSSSVRKVGSDSGLLPHTIGVKDALASQFTDVTDIGGYRPPDGYNEHSSGRAIDVMVPNWQTASGQAYGDRVTAEALANPNVQRVLWKQTQWNPDGTSEPMKDRGNPTQNHMDHVHVYTYPEARGAHPSGTAQSLESSTGGGVSAASLPGTAGTSGGGGGFNPGTSLSGVGSAVGGSGLSGFNPGTSLSGIGSALGEFAGGQLGSALDVLGVGDSPGWLQGISTLIGGMSIQGPGGQKIGGGSAGAALGGMGSMFGNAGPAAAKVGFGGGTPPPEAAHGTRAGQPAGPTFNTTIQARDAEGAMEGWRRWQNERVASKLGSY